MGLNRCPVCRKVGLRGGVILNIKTRVFGLGKRDILDITTKVFELGVGDILGLNCCPTC